jgi:ribosomal-protein-alanine N-acetyltransferase
VLAIEAASFEYAWTEEDFLRCLRQRNCIGMAAESYPDQRVVAFMIYELYKDRLHVLNFAVAPDCRRAGVGAALVAKLRGKLSSHRRSRLTLAVREANLPAQLFFWAQGLRATGVTRGYYRDTGEDAYHFEYKVPDAGDGSPREVPPNRVAQYDGG